MGKIVDVDEIMDIVKSFSLKNDFLEYALPMLFNSVKSVEAIPKDQYENRLKTDMVAMLTEIQLEVHELWDNNADYIEGVHDSEMVIQKKIDSMNGE